MDESQKHTAAVGALLFAHQTSHPWTDQLAAALGVTQPPRWRSRCRCSPAEGAADVCWTRANADRDEVGQRDLADRRPPLSHRDAEAVTGLQSPAATPWRSTFVTRLVAGLDEPRPRPRRPELVVLCHVSDCLDPAARPRASPNAFHARDVHRAVDPRGRRPRPSRFRLGLSGRPARPIGFAVVATMRTGFEARPRVGCQERTCWRRIGPAPLGRSEPSVLTASFPSYACS
jgi:hypothetical protein